MAKLKREVLTWQGVTVEYRRLTGRGGTVDPLAIYVWVTIDGQPAKGRINQRQGMTLIATVRAWVEAYKAGDFINEPPARGSGFIPLAYDMAVLRYRETVKKVAGLKQIEIKVVSDNGAGRVGTGNGNTLADILSIGINEDTLTAVKQWVKARRGEGVALLDLAYFGAGGVEDDK